MNISYAALIQIRSFILTTIEHWDFTVQKEHNFYASCMDNCLIAVSSDTKSSVFFFKIFRLQ